MSVMAHVLGVFWFGAIAPLYVVANWSICFTISPLGTHLMRHLVIAHQCRFGLKGTDQTGEALVKKPTRLLTNSSAIARQLNRQCTGGHQHATTVGQGKML